MVPILNLMNPVNIIPSYISKIHFNIIFPTHACRLSALFLSDFPSKSYMRSPPLHSCYLSSPSHRPSLDHSNYNGEQYKL
jgi:hypothetical protein